MDCPRCEKPLDRANITAEASGDWIEIILECSCGYRCVGWMQIEHMEEDEE